MATCTVTTPDAAAAFAASDPEFPSQVSSVFSGPLAVQVTLPGVPLSVLPIDQLLYSSTVSAIDVWILT